MGAYYEEKTSLLAAVGALSIFMSLNSFANQWVQFGQNWAYYQDDGTFTKNQWVGSSGAANSGYEYYRFVNGSLIQIESVYSEPGEDSIVWYNSINHSVPKQISMAEAEQIRNNYVHQSLTLVIIR